MATNNFYNHENGIFVLHTTTVAEAKESLEETALDNGEAFDFTDEEIQSEQEFLDQIRIEEFFSCELNYLLEDKGMKLESSDYREAKVYNKNGKLIAELSLKSGYYSDVQVIVETDYNELFIDNDDLFYDERIQDYRDDFVKSRLYEVYTPHNKQLFEVIKKCTMPINLVGSFSNGEAVYELQR